MLLQIFLLRQMNNLWAFQFVVACNISWFRADEKIYVLPSISYEVNTVVMMEDLKEKMMKKIA